MLRTEKREVPSEEGADKNMPAILQAWTGKISTAQPTKNFKSDHSCAFDDKRITEYERRNVAFQDDIKKPVHLAAAKMIPLMIMDIAFLKSFDVQWEAPHAALETGGAAASDDDDEVAMDIDTSSWVVTDPGTVPLKDLKLPARGKIQTHLMYAAAIVGIPDQRPPEVQSFLDQMQRRIEELALEYEANDPELIITRPFTDVEEET